MRYLFIATIVILIFSCTPKVTKEPPPVKVAQPTAKYLWVYKNTVNVRESNAANSALLTSLTDGDSVKVLQNDNGWYEITLNDGVNGWIRSDLLGTKNMSAFSKAIDFSNNLKENEKINLYFDKKIQHKRIFLEFPENEYSSKENIEKIAREIGNRYQQTVYPGKVTIQVIELQNQSEYLTIELAGERNADLDLPVIKYGILEKVSIEENSKLKISILIKETVKQEDLVTEARKIAGSFPLTFECVNINFVDLKNNCVLSFKEDASGENYNFNQCL